MFDDVTQPQRHFLQVPLLPDFQDLVCRQFDPLPPCIIGPLPVSGLLLCMAKSRLTVAPSPGGSAPEPSGCPFGRRGAAVCLLSPSLAYERTGHCYGLHFRLILGSTPPPVAVSVLAPCRATGTAL